MDRTYNQTVNFKEEPMYTFWLFDINNVLTAILLGAYGATILMGLFWNILIIRAFMGNRLPRNIILLHVCIADLLVCAISCPSTVIIIMQPKWNIGWFSCKVVYFVQVRNKKLLFIFSMQEVYLQPRPRGGFLIRFAPQED